MIAFQDRPDGADCDPVEARDGHCIEKVDLLDPSAAFSGSDDPSRRSTWRAVSQLSWQLWEDMAHQGFGDASALTKTLGLAGFSTLPDAGTLWEKASPDSHFHVSLPARARWLGADVWGLAPGAAPGIWRPLHTLEPDGLPAIPPVSVLTGRFALRLGFDGRPHDYDLMDADPASSGPFFEQLYPFRRTGDRAATLTPLGEFDLPEAMGQWLSADPTSASVRETLAPTLLTGDSYAGLASAAGRHFGSWARLLGVQIAQYALQDYTVNQMRVLAALTTMRAAPGSLEQRSGHTRNLVAAALGQTDSGADQEAALDPAVFALQGGFALRYEQLPAAVVRDWLATLGGETDPALLSQLNAGARSLLGDLVRSDAPPIGDASPDALESWAATALRPGADPQRFAEDIAQLALSLRVEALPAGDRDRVETWIVLDHVQFAVSSGLDATGATQISPAAYAAITTAAWSAVLRQHGYHTRALPQGLGAVDPTSICTTADGAAALDQPTIGVVNLDLVVSAKAGLTDPEAVLWAARGQVPLLAVDDPATSPPTLTWLVDLPGGEALYRVRWRLWSGWHLFWDAQPLPGGQTRLAARTGAVCSDLALAPDALVPTVLRAGLLAGELRPSVPVYRVDLRHRQKAPKEKGPPPDPDALLTQAAAAQKQAAGTAKAAQGAVKAFQASGSPTDLASLGSLVPKGDKSGLPEEEAVSDTVSWLRGLLRPGLDARAAQSGGLLVEVLDLDAQGKVPRLKDRPPRTPYLRARKAQGPDALRGAAWLLFFDGPKGRDATQLAPSTRPRASVSTDTPMPRWRRIWTQDFSLAAGLGAYPWRLVESTCSSQSTDLDVIAFCDGSAVTTSSQGLSGDLLALTTWWMGGPPRLGLEAGFDAQIDLEVPGTPLLYTADTTDYTWTLRPEGGIVLGLRWAPRPTSLWGRTAETWGAARPDGTPRDDRTQLGLRAGLLSGPGYNGIEASAFGELWWSKAIRWARAPAAAITPYYPAFVLGPYVRYAFGFPLSSDGGELLSLDQSHTISLGVRAWVRRKAKTEIPTVKP